ncbi:MAG: cobalt-precorrin-6A reductase [Notoacmeibacter sp.]
MALKVEAITEILPILANKSKVLILGGIKEAAELAGLLDAQGHDVISSLAGRTKEPAPLVGQIRVGGFGGPKGLADFLTENHVDFLIDATHPFAKKISQNAKLAAALTGCEFIIYLRPAWEKQAGDNWVEVESLDAACQAIPENARVLLALGSQHIAHFQSRTDVQFIVRMVDQPIEALALSNYSLVLGKPGDSVAETLLLQTHNISHIVCRNSGGVGAYAKITAARALGLTVIIINR